MAQHEDIRWQQRFANYEKALTHFSWQIEGVSEPKAITRMDPTST
jgi:hypothetical protein